MKNKQGVHSVIVLSGEKVLPVREQQFDSLMTNHPVKGWFTDKVKE